jgi:hypothetical protein
MLTSGYLIILCIFVREDLLFAPTLPMLNSS